MQPRLGLLAASIALGLTLAGPVVADSLNCTPSPCPSGSITPMPWPYPDLPDGTPVGPGTLPAGPGTQYVPSLPYFDPNGNMPAVEDPLFGFIAQILIPNWRSTVVQSDGMSFGGTVSDGITFDPRWNVIPWAGGTKWAQLPLSFYGPNTWVTFDNLETLGTFIITTIVVNGAEPWLRHYSIGEADGTISDDIFLSKSNVPGFNGHLQVDFASDPIPPVPEPSSWLLLLGSLGVLGVAKHRFRKRI